MNLVSCIFITQNKYDIIKNSIESYFNQTYLHKELVIVFEDDNINEPYFNKLIGNIKLIKIKKKSISLGEMRNLAIQNCNGKYIIQWDDDDIYSRYRIEYMINNLLKTKSDICILNKWLMYDYTTKNLYISNKYKWQGSMICKKEILQKNKYYNLSREEDLIINKITEKYKTNYIDKPELYLYTYHSKNTNNQGHFNNIFVRSKLLQKNISIEKIKKKLLNFYSKDNRYYQNVSIVMLTFNNLGILKKCIDSVLKVIDNMIIKEFIILDNNSDIETKIFLKNLRHNKIKVNYGKKNLGVTLGRKYLFSEAKGNFIVSLDSDIILNDINYIKKSIDVINSNNNVGLVGLMGYFHKSFNFNDILEKKGEGYVDYISGCVQIFSKEIIEKVSLDENYSPFWVEDSDFCLQIKNIGKRLYKLPAIYGIEHIYRSKKNYEKLHLINHKKKWNYFKNKIKINYEDQKFIKNSFQTINHFNDEFDGLSNIGKIFSNNYISNLKLYNGSPMYYKNIVNKHDFNMILLPFESSKIPNQWINELNKNYHICITTNSFLYSSFKNSGLLIPLYVVDQTYIKYNILDNNFPNRSKKNIFKLGINCSTLVLRKNLINLLIACNRISKKNKIELYLHVSSDCFDILKKIKLPNYVKLSNKKLNYEEMSQWYSNLDCYISCSFGEGWSMTPRESMYLGIPTIISDIPAHNDLKKSGYYEVIEPTKTISSYYEFEENYIGKWTYSDSKSIEKSILKVMYNRDKYNFLAKNGTNWISNKYTKESFLNSINHILNINQVRYKVKNKSFIKKFKSSNCYRNWRRKREIIRKSKCCIFIKNIQYYIINFFIMIVYAIANYFINYKTTYNYSLNPAVLNLDNKYIMIHRDEVSNNYKTANFKYCNSKQVLSYYDLDHNLIKKNDLKLNINQNIFVEKSRAVLSDKSFILEDMRFLNFNNKIYLYGPAMISYKPIYKTKITILELVDNQLVFKKFIEINKLAEIEKNWLLFYQNNKILILYQINDYLEIYRCNTNFEMIELYKKIKFNYVELIDNYTNIFFLDNKFKFGLSSFIKYKNYNLLVFHYKIKSFTSVQGRKYYNYMIILNKKMDDILACSRIFTENEYSNYSIIMNYSIMISKGKIIFWCGIEDSNILKIDYEIEYFFNKYFNKLKKIKKQ